MPNARSLAIATALAGLSFAAPTLASDPSLPPGYVPPPPGYVPAPGPPVPGAYGAPPAYGYPPPAYGYPPPAYGYPQGYAYGPPPVAKEMRSPALMGLGIGLSAVGAVSLTASSFVYLGSCGSYSSYSSSYGSGCGVPGGVIAMIIVGVVAIGAGVPLIVYGARRVPVTAAVAQRTPAWIGAPGGEGWTWKF